MNALGHTTIEDVAQAAGVSVATVSRALRDLPNVAPSTRDKVRAVADELSYVSNPAASRLAAGRTGTVAVVVPIFDAWYFSSVVAGIEAVLKAEQVDLLLYAVGNEEDRRAFFAGRGAWWQRSDALVMVDVALGAESAQRLSKIGAKIVTISGKSNHYSSVSLDEHHAAATATQHLIDRGHTRIGVLCGEPLSAGFHVPGVRLEGFCRAIRTAGLDDDPSLQRSGNFSMEGGAEAMAALLDLPSPPTAVFAMSDEMAFGALSEMRLRGLTAPNDMAIVGFDNHRMAESMGLTTIHQPVEAIGEMAGRAVLEAMRNAAGPVTHQIAETKLIVRATT